MDRLAIWMMTPEGDEPPEYLMGAIRGWFMTAADVPLSKIEWWGEHGADSQRAYQTACLLYGIDPKAFDHVADVVDLPDTRTLEICYELVARYRDLATKLKPTNGKL